MSDTKTAIRDEFQFHILNETGKQKAMIIALEFDAFVSSIEGIIGTWGGREMSIARTKLEEACFFAKKSMANQPENQEIKSVKIPPPASMPENVEECHVDTGEYCPVCDGKAGS